MWLKKAQSVNINLGKYPQQVYYYLIDLAEKSQDRHNEILNYQPNWQNIQQMLVNSGHPSPQQALSDLQSGDWQRIWNVRRQLNYKDTRLIDEVRKIGDKASDFVYSTQDAKADINRVIEQTKQNLKIIQDTITQAISRIDDWNGSPVTISGIRPPSDISSTENYGEPASTVSVAVGRQTGWGGVADFTFFLNEEDSSYEVDDLLEAGDNDFFNDTKIEQDYFSLVNELKNPGRTKSNKVLRLYTGRPKKDRSVYTNANSIPSNIFLTTSLDFAQSFGLDYNESRDVWEVRVEEKYLVQTLNDPSQKQYQTKPTSTNTVPVRSIKLIYLAD